jgi:hypothetical protein
MSHSTGQFTAYISGLPLKKLATYATADASLQALTNAGKATSARFQISGSICPRVRQLGVLETLQVSILQSHIIISISSFAVRADYDLVRPCCGVSGSTRMYSNTATLYVQ